MKKYKFFSLSVGWSDVFVLFPDDSNFKDYKDGLFCSNIKKSDYIGTYSFDENYLKLFEKRIVNGFVYYLRNVHNLENNIFKK